jgi:hypothetical protein
METPSYEQVGLRVRHLSLFIQITVLLHVEVMEGAVDEVHKKVEPSNPSWCDGSSVTFDRQRDG